MSGRDSPLPDWTRAHGEPVVEAAIRTQPSDFVVDEILGFEPSGTGEHDFLLIEKTGANTAWVARRLAVHAGIRPVDVGYSGLKDRHAVTTQWFSVRRPGGQGTDWSAFEAEGVRILDTARNDRKLRRGSHAANDFRIALRGSGFTEKKPALEGRIAAISARGVPNYFGPQRFGRDGGNVALAMRCFDGERMRREQRSLAVSAARSLIFNAILDRRVRDGSWNHLLAGDRANLDGTNSVFAVDAVTEELGKRCVMLDIHPTGTLWGDDAPLTTDAAAAVELGVAADCGDLAQGLSAQRVKAASRALRMRVETPAIDVADDVVWLTFRLRGGAFATSVVREIAGTDNG